MTGFRRVDERLVHQGYVWHLATAEFEAPDGRRFERNIIRSPGAVGVVPLVFDAEGNPSVVLVSQYRPPYDDAVIEVPAGMRDVPGEPPSVTAHRELAEEVGLRAGVLEELTVIIPSPGMSDATTHIFLASDCDQVDDSRQGPEEEAMNVLHVPLQEALEMVRSGRIADGKSVVGIMLASDRLSRGDLAP